MIIRDPQAGAVTDGGQIIPDVVVFPERFPTPDNPNPKLPTLLDIPFVKILFETLTGIEDLEDVRIKKHIWWHDLTYEEGRVDKRIWNAFNEDIELPTQSIDFSRISDVT
jgi:hypothetical protein